MNWQAITDMLPLLAEGAGLTLQLLFLSGFLGLCLAVPVAIARLSKTWWINILPRTYVFLFRGTPLLVQLFLIYFGLGNSKPCAKAFFGSC